MMRHPMGPGPMMGHGGPGHGGQGHGHGGPGHHGGPSGSGPPRGPGPGLVPPPPPTMSQQRQRPPNDCEIIVLGKQHQRYAEHVERSLRDLGLKVDLMFPKPDITLQTFVAHIASTGACFAVVIKADNEAHQSLTVHVLRPKAEEHRNMPLKTALTFIKDRFILIRQTEFTVVSPEFLGKIKKMNETHFLSDADYLYLTKYIQKRWDLQKLIENKNDYDPSLGINSIPQLQRKIMRVLGMEPM